MPPVQVCEFSKELVPVISKIKLVRFVPSKYFSSKESLFQEVFLSILDSFKIKLINL